MAWQAVAAQGCMDGRSQGHSVKEGRKEGSTSSINKQQVFQDKESVKDNSALEFGNNLAALPAGWLRDRQGPQVLRLDALAVEHKSDRPACACCQAYGVDGS